MGGQILTKDPWRKMAEIADTQNSSQQCHNNQPIFLWNIIMGYSLFTIQPPLIQGICPKKISHMLWIKFTPDSTDREVILTWNSLDYYLSRKTTTIFDMKRKLLFQTLSFNSDIEQIFSESEFLSVFKHLAPLSA